MFVNNGSFLKISAILRKVGEERTPEEDKILTDHADLVRSIERNSRARQRMLNRKIEKLDNENELEEKCAQLALAIRDAKNMVVYTGAGISTAASIPDYRGPNGVWTRIQKGEAPRACDPSFAVPTCTHMALAELHRRSLIKHIVSQNCDGLHLRSGIPRSSLSELHGNMFVELCLSCGKEYVRLFDVTEKTSLRKHSTGRKCFCGNDLKDTIVHFGEKGGLGSPQRWPEARTAAEKADSILVLGSSLKVLKKYTCLWRADKAVSQRPNLYIVNLQWTPKDDVAKLKVHATCDVVMKLVMQHLGLSIPDYVPQLDPLFKIAKPLKRSEFITTTRASLMPPLTPLPVGGDHSYAAYGIYCQNYVDDPDEKPDLNEEGDKDDDAMQVEDIKPTQTDCVKKVSTQPGWFGKGLKKQTTYGIFGKRKRRKLITVST